MVIHLPVGLTTVT